MNKNLRITFEFKGLDNRKYVSQKEMEEYIRWAKKMFYGQKLNLLVNEVQSALGVSWPWIDSHILENCRSIRYLKDFQDAETDNPTSYKNIYVNLEEVSKYLMSISTFDRQTKIVDYLEYAGLTEEEYLKKIALEELKQERKLKHDMDYNLSTIDPDYYDEMIRLERKRSKVPRVSVEKFDFLSDMIKCRKPRLGDLTDYRYIVANRSTFNNPEQLYRYVFRNGGIRIRIGEKKTIFAFEKHGYSYPQNTLMAPVL